MMSMRKSNRLRGFYLIGLLIVVAIIIILSYHQLAPEKKAEQVNFAKTSIDRSRDTACDANRVTAAQGITMWRINHPGEAPTIEKLRRDGVSIPGCPSGGIFSIRADGGEVYCSKHHPDPAALPPMPEPVQNPESE